MGEYWFNRYQSVAIISMIYNAGNIYQKNFKKFKISSMPFLTVPALTFIETVFGKIRVIFII